jgi:hypothetical protein
MIPTVPQIREAIEKASRDMRGAKMREVELDAGITILLLL